MRTVLIAGTAAATLALCACGSAPTRTPARAPLVSTLTSASVLLTPASGSLVSGKLTLVPTPTGVRVTGEVGSLPIGVHAIHIHEKGDCSAMDASSAGGHFNPKAQPHGKAGSAAHHGGDMDNIIAATGGVARVDVEAFGVTLGGDASTDAVGRAVVVHAMADDYRSQPAGNAGARIACGVIRGR